MEKLDGLLKQAGDLPSLPEVYIRVNELLDTDNATAIQIGDALQTDPALTARILKLINSAYYGLRNPVTSISQAVTLLGRKYLQQALTGSVLAQVFKDFNINEFPLRDFWQHSIKTAIIARQLAMQNARIIDHEAFFTAGLLHDIGWLVIAKVIPNAYLTVSDIARAENRDIILVETEKLGVTHIDVGVALLDKWGIPGLIIQCVKMHHETDHSGPMSIETSVVAMANQLSRHSLPDDEEALTELLSAIPYWEESKCTAEQVGIACNLAEDQWLDVMESLGMLDLDLYEEEEDPFLFNTNL